jgi:hypothetical protein
MKQLLTLLFIAFLSQGMAQPLASPKELGMKQQYFFRTGLSYSSYLGAYEGDNTIEINPDDATPDNKQVTTASLPKFNPQFIYRVAIGSRLNQHHFALDLGYAPIEKGYYEFVVDYQYQFGTKGGRPSLSLGLDYMQIDVKGSAQRGNNSFDASFAGKGFHLGSGYNFYSNHFGWENRFLIRGLSIDNVFIAEGRYQISGLLFSWQPSLESQVLVFF